MDSPLCRYSVEVLLATWNGEKYLPALLDSLLAQSFSNFTLVVADDCSNDTTLQILERYRPRFGGRLKVLPCSGSPRGASGNFAYLIEQASADYVFFCDQDDVWLPDKMMVTLRRMEELAARHAPDTPLLVHTDLAVVGADLELLGDSFCRYAGIRPTRSRIGHLLLGNIATGCTMLVNRALYRLARPLPEVALMYDHWLVQVAAATGAIEFVDQATILYRQHAANCVGAEKAGTASLARRVARILFSDDTLQVLFSYSLHARSLLDRYGSRMSERDRRKAAALAGVWELPRFKRFWSLVRSGLRKPGIAQNIGLFLLLWRDVALLAGANNRGNPSRPPCSLRASPR